MSTLAAYARLRARMLALAVVWVLLLAGLGAFTASRQRSLAATLETVYSDRIVAQAQLRALGDAMGRQVAAAMVDFRTGQADAAQSASRLAQSRQSAAQNWKHFLATRLVDEESRLVARAQPLLAQADAAVAEAQQQMAAADLAGLQAWEGGVGAGHVVSLLSVVDELFALQTAVASRQLADARSANERAGTILLAVVVAGCLLGGAAAWALFVNHTRAAEQSERALRRMNAFYTALSRTNHLILHAKDEATLLHELSELCVETGHAVIAAVFLLDGGQVTRFATAGPQAEFFLTFPTTWSVDAPEHRLSMTVTALTVGLPCCGRVALLSSESAPWRDHALTRGIRSVAAFPLLRAGQIYGSLTLCATDTDCFDEPLVKLLTEMAANVSFALDNIDRQVARLRLEQQTQTALERFRKVFQSSPVACVISTLADAVVLEVNDVLCSRYGVRREDVIGKSRGRLGTLLIEADAQRYRDELHREGRVHNMSGRTPLPDGSMAEIIANAETIDYQGQPCVMAMLLDVTDLRAAEAARQARATAEAANRAKTVFLSQMSHELRTPLNAMLGFTQLMQRDAGGRLLPQDLEQLDQIRRAGWHLLSLINDVMDVSRIEAGQFQVLLGPVLLTDMLDQVMRISQASAHSADVTLQSEAYSSSVAVLADPVRLRQVLINLVSNAVKYNRPGGSVRIQVQCEAGRVTVAVVDTGPGMSPEQLLHLYEPFNRLGRERGGIEGTGLGLALTRQLVSLMGGDLKIESRLGLGTDARITLPEATRIEADEASESLSAAAVADDRADPQGAVLYIEDNEINVMLVEQMLSRWSLVRFVHAGDGQSGIEQAAELQPDLVLLDMHLPDMDGTEILRRLQRREDTRSLRVVVLSASDGPGDAGRLLAEGAVDYWTKPVELDRFLSGMKHHLGARER